MLITKIQQIHFKYHWNNEENDCCKGEKTQIAVCRAPLKVFGK